MKKLAIISALVLTAAVVVTSCKSKRDPGRIYMPDMAYSRAYETYDLRDSAVFMHDMSNASDWGRKIFYNSKPVEGTIKRGDSINYAMLKDTAGQYGTSSAIKNPLGMLSKPDSAEAGRLFNIYCGVCHGTSGKANGPVAGKVGGVKDLTSDEIVKLSDGTIYFSVTYGKNNMGGYASQLDAKQRWMVVNYVRLLQKSSAPAPAAASAAPAKADTVKAKTK